MAKLHQVKSDGYCDQLAFQCPACGYAHFVFSGNCPERPYWYWNYSLQTPTFSPSIRVQGKYHCHSFVEDGWIRFLGDCDHQLAGQTVELPEWEGFCDG